MRYFTPFSAPWLLLHGCCDPLTKSCRGHCHKYQPAARRGATPCDQKSATKHDKNRWKSDRKIVKIACRVHRVKGTPVGTVKMKRCQFRVNPSPQYAPHLYPRQHHIKTTPRSFNAIIATGKPRCPFLSTKTRDRR